MSNETILYLYIFGWIVWSCVLIDKANIRDIAASFIAGILWPIGMPVVVLRKLLN